MMMRRTIAVLLSAVAASTCQAGPAGPAGPAGQAGQAGNAAPRVAIDSGIVEGTASGGLLAFQGIPYAGSPAGSWRWKPPRPVARWTGVRAARELGPACPQPDRGLRKRVVAALGGDPSTVSPLGPTSEDCLFANVWTARPGREARRPVIVWLHGGSFAVGSGGDEAASLARLGAVVVTINYRLGLLGFMAHPALTRESPHGSSGNYGLLDQIAALRWVRRNIAAFGGDPDRVLVAGHSSGAGAVLQLLATPLARGLFQRAAAQSSSGGMSRPLADAESEGVAIADRLGAPAADPLPALRAAAVERLLAVGPRGHQSVTDGWVLPASVPSLLRAGGLDPMPLIVGATASEATIFAVQPQQDRAAYRALLLQTERSRSRVDRVLALYPAATDAEAAATATRYVTDRDFVCPARRVAATRRGPTWLYLVSAPPAPGPAAARYGAFHGSDLRLLFDLDMGVPLGDVASRAGEAMRRYWVRFAATGDPNQPGLPAWPVYQGTRPRHLDIGDPVRAVEGLGRPGCAVFDG